MAKKEIKDMTKDELIKLAKKEYSINLQKTYPKEHMITLIEAAEKKAEDAKPKKDDSKKRGEY